MAPSITAIEIQQTPFYRNASWPYFPYPFSLVDFDSDVSNGLIGLTFMGALSLVSTVLLLVYISWKLATERQNSKSHLDYVSDLSSQIRTATDRKQSQYLILFINLLIADAIQAASFIFSAWWRHEGSILAPTSPCTAQGWLLNLGDIASGFFVLLIAVFTFHSTVNSSRVGAKTFLGIVISTWVLCWVLTALGPILHGEEYFVRAGVWCWAASKFEVERLVLHYLWIFFCQFMTFVIYGWIYINIKLRIRATTSAMDSNLSSNTTYKKIDRATRSMIMYPIAYVFLTLPLSAGRMWSLAHGGRTVPLGYLFFAGTTIASSGFIDACLYAATRSVLLAPATRPGTATGGTNNSNTLKDRFSRAPLARFNTSQDRPVTGEKSSLKPADDNQEQAPKDSITELIKSSGGGINVVSTVTVSAMPQDPYALGSGRRRSSAVNPAHMPRRGSSAPRRSSSVPSIVGAEKSQAPADYGFGYSSTEHFVARSASGTGLGLSIDGGDDDEYRRRELDLAEQPLNEEEGEEEAGQNGEEGENYDYLGEMF